MDRLKQWKEFSLVVEEHIKNYANVQYENPYGDEQVDGFTCEDCWNNLLRYVNRRHSAVRGGREQLRDIVKIAHYAQFIYNKLPGEQTEGSISDDAA